MVKCHEFDKNGTELKLPDHNAHTERTKEKKITSEINKKKPSE